MKTIIRNKYLNKLIDIINTPDIKVITGVRRSRKSKLLESFIDYIKVNVTNANIIHIDFNLTQFEYLMEYHNLEDYIEKQYVIEKENFILIDEVQMCIGFEKAINSLHAKSKYDIYITGSNAFLLSSDLATLFTGRTFEIKVFPFSFKEYKDYFNIDNNYPAFDNYIREGGMSGSYTYKNIEDKLEYVNNIYDTLITRDILKKYKIKIQFF